jgi:hypothetical protein
LGFRQVKKAAAEAAVIGLSLSEGLAVGTLVHGRVLLVGTNQDAVQGAVVRIVAVVSARLNGTLDTLVCMLVHDLFLLCFGFLNSMAQSLGIMR